MSCARTKQRVAAMVVAILLASTGNALAHGGGLNRQGCHTVTATGEYHCHGDKNDSAGTALVISVVGLVVLAAWYWFYKKREARSAMLAAETTPSRNPMIPTLHATIDRGETAEAKAVWKIGF